MPEHAGAPGGDIDRSERLLAVGVVVVAMVVAVIVGQVMLDGTGVSGRVAVGVRGAHRPHSRRRSRAPSRS